MCVATVCQQSVGLIGKRVWNILKGEQQEDPRQHLCGTQVENCSIWLTERNSFWHRRGNVQKFECHRHQWMPALQITHAHGFHAQRDHYTPHARACMHTHTATHSRPPARPDHTWPHKHRPSMPPPGPQNAEGAPASEPKPMALMRDTCCTADFHMPSSHITDLHLPCMRCLLSFGGVQG